MEKKQVYKLGDGQRCPNCGGQDLTVMADHETDGYNGYRCNDCGCHFGN